MKYYILRDNTTDRYFSEFKKKNGITKIEEILLTTKEKNALDVEDIEMNLIGEICDVSIEPKIENHHYNTYYTEDMLENIQELGDFSSLKEAAEFIYRQEKNFLWKVNFQ